VDEKDAGSQPIPKARWVRVQFALTVPTVADRVAQEVVRRYLEPRLDPLFHADSYGYRPGRSAIDAVRTARQRCWRYNWVLDLDIKAFFDTIPHELLLKALRAHTDCRWVMPYVKRWSKAPVQREDGCIEPRDAGTPQGSVVSPILANLFLHYTFDLWMTRPIRPFPLNGMRMTVRHDGAERGPRCKSGQLEAALLHKA
jgi:RNA-directed DNA polymerase